MISEIKNIIKEFGSFSTCDLELDNSPTIPSYGNLVHLIDYFNLDNVEVEVYLSGGESPIDEYTLPYEELSEELLFSIFKLAIKWKDNCTELALN